MPVYRASLEIASTPACPGNLEIALMLVFPVSRAIEWTRGYRANPEIESMPVYLGSLETARILASRGSQT